MIRKHFSMIRSLAKSILLISMGALAANGGSLWADGKRSLQVQHCINGGLDWVANTQSRLGNWTAVEGRYPTAMTALAGIALLQEGSTTTQGKYAPNIRRA